MSNLYTIIKKYYEKGIYTIDNLKTFVQAGKITEDELNSIING